MTATHEKINIEKDLLNAKADFVITACKDEKVLSKVREKVSELSEDVGKKVKICLVGELLRMDLGKILSEQMRF